MIPISTIVEMMSCSLRVYYTLSKVSTFMQCVDKILTKIQIKIPKAISSNGYIKLLIMYLHPLPLPINVVDDITNAAQVDSANDPNKSALIPATSPTLSPTLSAIVAGFFGLSSGRFFSTLPTKSAPTSAAFV